MHSIWQEQMEFPVYPILKRDKKTDILYVGATLKHAIEANFQKEMGRSVMIIEEKSIGAVSYTHLDVYKRQGSSSGSK